MNVNDMNSYTFYDKYIDGLEFVIVASSLAKAREYLAIRIEEANELGYTLPHISQWQEA